MPDNHLLIIFGASGDLTYRKLVPSIFDLFKQGLLPEHFAVLGVGRTQLTDEEFQKKMIEGIQSFSKLKPDKDDFEQFSKLLCYQSIDTKKF